MGQSSLRTWQKKFSILWKSPVGYLRAPKPEIYTLGRSEIWEDVTPVYRLNRFIRSSMIAAR